MQYNDLASSEAIQQTINSLQDKNFLPILVQNKEEALAKIKELIPTGVSVMNGASKTLEEIGFVEYLKSGQHGWNNLHEGILAETDPVKQAQLRKEATLSDFYLGSVHGLSQTGELVIASNTGSQLPHLVFTSQNLVLVVGVNKITSDLPSALERIEKHVIPLEDERMNQVYGFGTMYNKTVILRGENPHMGRKVHVIIVNESLGF